MFCSESKPPPAGDSDSSIITSFEGGTYDVIAPELDTGSPGLPVDGGVVIVRDYHGLCDQGKLPVWHYFDFQTHTPPGTAINLRAQSAGTQLGLDGAPQVQLGTVTGPDITVWTGVDVDTKLATIGQKSQRFLRLSVTFASATDGTPPVLVHFRQQYDCVLGQ